MYCVADASPVSEYVVDVVAVLDTIVENAPPEVDLSIAYPDIVPEGAVQLRSICDEETVVAVNPVGEPDGVGNGGGVNVVAEPVLEGEPVPAELIADTL